MKKKTILLIGLEKTDATKLRKHLGIDYIVLHFEMLPNVKLVAGKLYVESTSVMDKFIEVDEVIFHGIFENDVDFLTLLALWNGPCMPNAIGMMDLRQRIPGLARVLQVTNFGDGKRGMTIGSQVYTSETEVVAKWGVWHCGEDKHKFSGTWQGSETSVVEDFIYGEAVRIMMIGNEYWQIKLTGDTWLKSIHNEGADKMEINPALLEDSKKIAKHFKMEIIGVDYMISKEGQPFLLEVNHIPNVTVFPFVNEAFLKYVTKWIKRPKR
jgi:Tubulin-tyrosine ligase family